VGSGDPLDHPDLGAGRLEHGALLDVELDEGVDVLGVEQGLS
jgi:hypothetical protein